MFDRANPTRIFHRKSIPILVGTPPELHDILNHRSLWHEFIEEVILDPDELVACQSRVKDLNRALEIFPEMSPTTKWNVEHEIRVLTHKIELFQKILAAQNVIKPSFSKETP